jgi:hypothetical protein
MNAVQDSYESLTGSLGSVTADSEDLVNSAADNRECELLVIEPLAKINVGIKTLGHSISLKLGMVPESGDMFFFNVGPPKESRHHVYFPNESCPDENCPDEPFPTRIFPN